MDGETKNIVIFSSNNQPPIGRQEIWTQAAETLISEGFQIHVFKYNVNFADPNVAKLQELGCRIVDLTKYLPSLSQRILIRLLPDHPERTLPSLISRHLANEVERLKPKLFIISQTGGFDAFNSLKLCPLDRFPFVVITQRVNKNQWANDWERDWIVKCWQNSARNYFLSNENLALIREQFCLKMENAEVLRNYAFNPIEPVDWEFANTDKIRLACVSEPHEVNQGHDILLRVLTDKKWRERNLEVSFYGNGSNRMGFLEFTRFLQLENVFFDRVTPDISSIWQNHQALILPSLNEGLSLDLVEAMMCGRMAIATNVGGNRDVVVDNLTGFLAKSVDEAGLDEALERAWQRVDEWKYIGKLAAQTICRIVPTDTTAFARKLITIINETSSVNDDASDLRCKKRFVVDEPTYFQTAVQFVNARGRAKIQALVNSKIRLMPRIGVFMSDNRALQPTLNSSSYHSQVAAINYTYCKKHNYDFVYYRPYLDSKESNCLNNCIDPNTNQLRHASWAKLLSAVKMSENPYDYLVYIDSDCIFKDFNRRIEEFFPRIKDFEMIFLNNSEQQEAIWNEDKPCAGFFICKNSETARKYIKNWYLVDLAERNRIHAYEQDALWTIFQKWNVGIVNSLMFQENKGQFLRHICHLEAELRRNAFKQFIRQHHIDYEATIPKIRVNEYDTRTAMREHGFELESN